MDTRSDKELADAVVKLGIGEYYPAVNSSGITVRSEGGYGLPEDCEHEYECDKFFVRDWRVAGLLMEKCEPFGTIVIDQYGDIWQVSTSPNTQIDNESLPRAIIEACIEALSDE